MDRVGAGEVEMPSAGGCEDGDGVGEFTVFFFELGECVRSGLGWVVFVDVDDEEVSVQIPVGGDAEPVVAVWAGEPAADCVLAGGGKFLPFGDSRIFFAGLDRDDMANRIWWRWPPTN